MIQEGLFDKFPCDAVFGMHNRPNLPVGRFAVHFGPMMAAGAFFDIHITGMGAHGARPETSIDPVMVASHIAVSLQTIISRSLPPLEAAVLSITKIQAGNAYNVIPQTAHLAGTVRSFSYTVMEKIEEKMKQIVRGVASALGAKAEMEFRITFAPTVNDPKEAAFAADICSQVVGTENVNQKPSLVMGSEDFSFMLEKVPGCFINIGTGGKNTRNRKVHEVHHPSYDFNDAAIPLGVEFFVRLVEARLAQNASTHDDATA
jgi:amidohydrolase